MRRFQNRMRASGQLIQAKKVRFHDKSQSRNQRRRSALERTRRRLKIEYLIKTGQMKELPAAPYKRR